MNARSGNGDTLLVGLFRGEGAETAAVCNLFLLLHSFLSVVGELVPLIVSTSSLRLLFLLFLVLVVDDLLLVEDLLALAVADEERRGEGDHDEGHPGDAVAETEAPGPALT